MKNKPTSKLPHNYIAIWKNHAEDLLDPPLNMSDADAEKVDAAGDKAAIAALDCKVTKAGQIAEKIEVMEFYGPSHDLFAYGLKQLKLDLLSLQD